MDWGFSKVVSITQLPLRIKSKGGLVMGKSWEDDCGFPAEGEWV